MPPVNVTFLGGLGEIGRNMCSIEVDGRLAVVDCGVFFPNPEHLGVDLILPDWTVLKDRADDVDAVFLTHGHLDHIGAVPYLLQDIPGLTIYGTKLTLAFVEAMLEEWEDLDAPDMVEVVPGDTIDHGPFKVEVVQVSHSIPDGCAYAFRTPHGLILHSGDFKMDQTPVDDLPTDIAHLARLGDEGVDLLLADSTNADVPGHVPTERTVGRGIEAELRKATGLVVVASFASHVHRIQQVLEAAKEVGRRPVFVGRSMVRNMGIARELGYLEYDEEEVVELHDVKRHRPSELIIISTGSQGEPFSALSLMAAGDHKHVSVGEGDTIILASSLIPGNEHAVFRSINGLAKRGCRVVHKGVAPVHVSGHANREDLVLYHNIVEPEFFVPVHGEYRHMIAHRDIAIDTGIIDDHVLLCEDGDVVHLEDGRAWKGEQVQAGQVFIDGLLTDVGPAVLRDRSRLANDGICVCVVTIDPRRGEVVEGPQITQKGVVFHEEEDDILEAATKAVVEELDSLKASKFTDAPAIQRHVTQALGRYWKQEVGRRPVILPIVLEA
ncbi:MAG: ribonuclease J [Actinobacteria bacterium]|nr:ribonuclease J [Actinomycetota bacterium]